MYSINDSIQEDRESIREIRSYDRLKSVLKFKNKCEETTCNIVARTMKKTCKAKETTESSSGSIQLRPFSKWELLTEGAISFLMS